MNDIDPARALRYYLPIWLALMLLTVTVSVLGVVGNGAAAILWIASFLGAIVALVLIVAADELDESRAKRPLVPVEAARPDALSRRLAAITQQAARIAQARQAVEIANQLPFGRRRHGGGLRIPTTQAWRDRAPIRRRAQWGAMTGMP